MKVPENIPTTEELYLSALHLEQYRHATYEPADYYLEGLRRDPTDLRLNNGYGLLLLRRGHAKEAIPYFQKAIDKQTFRNPNPYHGPSPRKERMKKPSMLSTKPPGVPKPRALPSTGWLL